jgi:hypothetical protein
MIPVGSLTAVHEIVNGWVTTAPSAGEIGDGAGGAAAALRPVTLRHKMIRNNSVRDRQTDVCDFINIPPIDRREKRRRISPSQGEEKPPSP